MATALELPQDTNGSPLQEIVSTFLKSSELYGFHLTNDWRHNGATDHLITAKVRQILGRLKFESEAKCTRRSLDHVVFWAARRKPFPRPTTVRGAQTTVPNELVNEFALVQAANILRYPYRGVSEAEVLRELKEFCVWHLGVRCKYELPDEELLFHERALDWARQGQLWRLVYENDHWSTYFSQARLQQWKPTIALVR